MKLYANIYWYLVLAIIHCSNCFTSNDTNILTSAFGETLSVQPEPYNQIKFTYNISSYYVQTGATGVGASVAATGGFAVLSCGTSSTGSANLRSINRLQYHPGQGSVGMVAGYFSTGAANNTQIMGIGNAEDGFFFGYTGTSFGILHRSNSSGSVVDNWIPQASWNIDTMDGSGPSAMVLDPTKGNVYKVQYQWLGFGAVRFYIEDATTGNMQLVHLIQYANQNTNTTLANPSLQLRADVINFGNTVNKSINLSSVVAYSEGKYNAALQVRNAIDRGPFAVATTPTHVFTIHNKPTFQNKTNQVMVNPDLLSVMDVDTADDAILFVYLNPTITATGTFADVSTNNSVIEYTNTGTISGGQLKGVFYSTNNNQLNFPLTDLNLILAPDQYLTFVAQGTAAITSFYASLSWQEDF